ncbi:MAG TPA: hypothetical protein PKK26_12965 [Candidatus Wallbacteria bacterium]|nr:hypothetical protein [Candidatus Wallbacteria bacterium]
MFKQKINDFEKITLKLLAASAAFISPFVFYYAGSGCLLSFLLGCFLAIISFTAIVWTAYLIIPADSGKKAGTREKLLVFFSYVLKISLFIAAFIFLSKSGIKDIVAFLGGFSLLFPSLLISGILFGKKDQTPA